MRANEREKNRARLKVREGKKEKYVWQLHILCQPASQPDSDANETAVAVAMAAQLILFIERLLVDLFIYITSFIYTLLYTRD